MFLILFTRRLYQEASVRKAKEIDRSKSIPRECSFEPSISISQSWTAPNRETAARGGSGTKARADTPTRLYNTTRHKIERREALQRKGEEDVLAKCTFRPSIPKRPSSASRVRAENSKETPKAKEDIGKKLYNEATERDLRLQIEKDKIANQIKVESNVAVSINKINSPTSPSITANNNNTRSTLVNYDDSTNTAKKMYPVTGSFEDRMKSNDERVSEKIKKKKVSFMYVII
jgi:hypothetical protein